MNKHTPRLIKLVCTAKGPERQPPVACLRTRTGLGFRVSGFGFRVSGLWFRVYLRTRSGDLTFRSCRYDNLFVASLSLPSSLSLDSDLRSNSGHFATSALSPTPSSSSPPHTGTSTSSTSPDRAVLADCTLDNCPNPPRLRAGDLRCFNCRRRGLSTPSAGEGEGEGTPSLRPSAEEGKRYRSFRSGKCHVLLWRGLPDAPQDLNLLSCDIERKRSAMADISCCAFEHSSLVVP